MTAATIAEPTVAGAELGARRRASVWRRIWRDGKGRAGVVVLAVIALACLVGPEVIGIDALAQDLRARNRPMYGDPAAAAGHPLGTDHLGRDLLARILLGGRISLFIGIVSSLLASAFGVGLGLVAGFYGGRIDAMLMRVADVQLTFPSILLALAALVMLGPGIGNLVIVLAISSWVFTARIVRAEALSLTRRDFVDAGRALGAPDHRLILGYLAPNVAGSVLVLFTLTVVRNILAESSLSFLGLGIQLPTPSWGGMLAEGRPYLATAWWVGTLPGLALVIAIVAINLVGDSLRDILDPRIQTEGN